MLVGSDGLVSRTIPNDTRRQGRFRTQHTDEHGDLVITAGASTHARTYAVADLIAMCFCDWYTNDCLISHINGDKLDNRPGNLTSLRQI